MRSPSFPAFRLGLLSLLAASEALWAQRASIPVLAREPYVGAIVVSAEGDVLHEDNADAIGYPASMIKLMNLLLILEDLERGKLTLEEPVLVTAEAARIGGSQVYLKEGERFPLQELLYAMMVQSANDAATALAIHIAGSKEGFVDRMNRRAAELGMGRTRFHSVHGLPPAPGQEPDRSTPRDLARLCVALLKRPEALTYTSVIQRPFRAESPNPFIMQNHNRLLTTFEGCDGLKTGFFKAGGYSIAATASRGGVRVVAIIMGSLNRLTRDAKTREGLTLGLTELAARPPPVASAVTPAGPEEPEPAETPPTRVTRRRRKWIWAPAAVLTAVGLLAWLKHPRYPARR